MIQKSTICAITCWLMISATDSAAQAKPAGFHTDAWLIGKEGEPRKIELVAATRTSIRYRVPSGSSDVLDLVLNRETSVYVSEPPDYTEAMNLYRARNYAGAKAKLIAVKERYRPIEGLEDSITTLAAFYELECLRKLGDLDGLAAELQKFPKGNLSRAYQATQLELYVLWDALRTKSWERLESLAKERSNVKLPGDQRSQVAYCHGLALEGLDRPSEALIAYQTTITADAGASEVITRQAALRILAIYHEDAEVKAAIKLRGSPQEAAASSGGVKLAQAQAVAALFEITFGGGIPLPTEFNGFTTSVRGKKD